MQNKIIKAAIAAVLVGASMTACTNDADVVNENLSKDADNFKVLRRTVAYNSITGEYLFVVEGYCSLDMADPSRYTMTCKSGDRYIKNLVGKSDNVTVFSEQLESSKVSASHYKVIFKPSVIIPEPEIR